MRRVLICALVAIAACMQPVFAQQLRPMIGVRNSSPNQNGALLVGVYAVPSHTPGNWGINHLGSIVVGTQSVVGILLTPGFCLFDVRLVFDNGFSAERRSVDACSGGMTSIIDVSGGYFTGTPGFQR